jgi:putative ABC transport system permease protein
MATLREWVRRLWGTLRRNPRDRELEDELRLHLELAGEDMRRRGGASADARRAALLQAGGTAQAMEALRDQRGLPWLDDLARDGGYGLRSLRRSPGFASVALLTLALGIGANTAMFSIVNGVVLQPLAYPESDRLMYLNTRLSIYPDLGLSPPEYLEFREFNRSFATIGAFAPGEVSLTAGDRSQRVRSVLVDEHLIETLGIRPAQGRAFAVGETQAIGALPPTGITLTRPIAILSHELWQTAFGGQAIVGNAVQIDGRQHEVIGIMPPGTDVMDSRIEIWLPLGLDPAIQNRGAHYLHVIGRLQNGVTMQSAQMELDALVETWSDRVGIKPGPGGAGHIFAPMTQSGGHILQMKPLQDRVLGDARRAIWVLQAGVGLVLLIACANLASLLLARAETRRYEFVVRKALGASRARLLRQFITEGVLLSVLGGALGVWLARAGVRALIRAYPTSLPRTSEIAVDWVVLLVTLGAATVTGVLFGLAPMIHARVERMGPVLHGGGGTRALVSARQHIRRGLVVGEVALAVVLAVGAGLLLRTVYNLTQVDAGFDNSRLVTFSMTLPQAGYPLPSRRAQLYDGLLDDLRALPGVEAATAVSGLPPTFPAIGASTDIDGYSAPPQGPFEVVDYYQYVMSDYFETMGIPIVAGRGFEQADAASSGLVAVVNETFVKTFSSGQNPIRRRLRRCGRCDDGDPWFTVIGVAKDVKQRGLDRETGTEVYVLTEQAGVPRPINLAPGTMNVVLRTTQPPASLSTAIASAVRDVDPTIPVVRLRDMEAVFVESIGRPRLLAELVGAFAALAVLLAAVGTYGVLSYMAAARRREIGIRMALGADRSRVLAQIMKQGLWLTIIGVVIGVAGALGLSWLIASLLFGVQPTDAATVGAVVTTILLVTCLACWLPAWRASRLDPIAVLREE